MLSSMSSPPALGDGKMAAAAASTGDILHPSVLDADDEDAAANGIMWLLCETATCGRTGDNGDPIPKVAAARLFMGESGACE
mmetsp:Transcript_10762/g.25648  ORF Transcript_10762/g.25648 Transcript_10762/m.25648 type:complete len:82 (-) Transcript_10762:1664-1909(-)